MSLACDDATIAVVALAPLACLARVAFCWTGDGCATLHGLLRAVALLLFVPVCVALYFGVLYLLGFRVGDFKRTGH